MKAIESIISNSKKVYVKMKSEEICKQFFEKAEREGFIFGDGSKPMSKHPSNLVAVCSDKTLCYVTSIGRIAVQSGAKNIIVYDCEKIFAD